MRIVANERRIRLNQFLATSLSLLSVVLLTASIIYPIAVPRSTTPTPPLPLVVAALIIAAIGLRLGNVWLRRPTPHQALRDGLKGFGNDCVLYQYSLPAPHVLVCSKGIFTLTALPQRSPIVADGDKTFHTESLLPRLLHALGRQDSVRSPLLLAQQQAHAMQMWLDKHISDNEVQVQPLLVFTHPEMTLEVRKPILPVVYADKRKPSLKTAIRKLPDSRSLTAQQLSLLESAARISAAS